MTRSQRCTEHRRRIGQTAGLCALVLCASAAFVWLRPHRVLNGPTEMIVVAGTSMEPRFHTGDLVVVRHNARYHVGDVIAYSVPAGEDGAGARVIHRIVAGSPRRGFRTQGDNREQRDPWVVPSRNIIGREWAVIPWYRTIIDLVPARLLFATLVGTAVMLLVWPHDKRRQSPSTGDDVLQTCGLCKPQPQVAHT
jgi:signal peptidase I